MVTVTTQNIAASNDATIHYYVSAENMEGHSHDLTEGTEKKKQLSEQAISGPRFEPLNPGSPENK